MVKQKLETDQGPPPRVVEPWTRVVGHTIVRSADGFCECGWRRRAGEDETVEDHLRDAWPVLVPRRENEAHAAWRGRVAILHGEAVEAVARLWEQHGMGHPIQPGASFPVNPPEYDIAEDRVAVLERQLQELTRAAAEFEA